MYWCGRAWWARIADQAGAVEEPVLVPMSEAERSAAVAALAEILAAWWVRRQPANRPPVVGSGGEDSAL